MLSSAGWWSNMSNLKLGAKISCSLSSESETLEYGADTERTQPT